MRSYIDLIGRQRQDQSPRYLNDIEACYIIYQVLQALAYLHDKGVVHRDIKPENILINPTQNGERIILTDFGSSTKLGGHFGYTSKRIMTLCGTPNYAAP